MARRKLKKRSPKKTSTRPKIVSGRNKTSQKLVSSTFQKPNRLSSKNILVVILALLILAAVGKTVFNRQNESIEDTAEAPQSSLDGNPEAAEKLKEVYEKERGISLREFAPRYSIFENADYGYRFAYPVGYNYQWNGQTVELTPKSNQGKIAVAGKNGSFDVKTDTSGTSDTDAQALEAAAEFIRQTFEFTNTAKSGTKERFDTSDGPVYKY